MARKTKRISPPPLQNTIDYDPSKFSEKFSKVLQLITPPNKKRRAIALIGQKQTYEEEESDSDDDQVLMKQKKQLNRRGIYIENPPKIQIHGSINDGPQGAKHSWATYCQTVDKLRSNSLPLLESLQLRKMLVKLQTDQSIQRNIMMIQQKARITQLDKDDNTPLAALLTNNRRVSPPIDYKKPFPLFHLSTVHTI